MRLKKGYEGDYGVNYYSPLFEESDWPVTFIVRLQFTEEWGDNAVEQMGKYHVEIHAVSPEAVSEQEVASACRSMSVTPEQFKDELDRDSQCEILMEYGISACIWQRSGNNREKLLKAVRHELKFITFLFGFYMDKPLNRIGNTGWDFIRGDIGFKHLHIDSTEEEVTT